MAETVYIPRLRTYYDETIRPELTKQFEYKNVMELPKLDKIVLNMGVGEAVNDTKKVRAAAARRCSSRSLRGRACSSGNGNVGPVYSSRATSQRYSCKCGSGEKYAASP